MKKINFKIAVTFTLIFFCLFSSEINAQGVKKVGTAAATFLRIPVGARAAGMGSSFVSMINDPTGVYWNPSVMSSVNSKSLVVDHSLWLPGIYFDFAGLELEAIFGKTVIR